ncbi:MAG: LysM peptidoglycan-binding domain-containing protein [Ignavibacteriaceae bacterium]|nr:LysM peptidoglycan-binding domain-containing protein [Ignavibacteriaceae bacterium]
MSLQVKYSPVLALLKELGMKDVQIKEDGGVLNLMGTVNTQFEKNQIWDKIKDVAGESHPDIKADIKVLVSDYYHVHKVAAGENLSKISKLYYKDPNRYMDIFNANKDKLSNPDLIKPGQELKIPNP